MLRVDKQYHGRSMLKFGEIRSKGSDAMGLKVGSAFSLKVSAPASGEVIHRIRKSFGGKMAQIFSMTMSSTVALRTLHARKKNQTGTHVHCTYVELFSQARWR